MAITVAEANALAEIRMSLKACASEEGAKPPHLILPLKDLDAEVVISLPPEFSASEASQGPLKQIRGVGAIRTAS